MFAESLRLKGFRGIRDGMNRDEIVLDLTKLPAEAALVALSGANGRGKTTLMDNLTPYPVMPSRATQDGLGRFSYYEHLCVPEAEKELIWRHEGRRFRSHLVFRINGKRKTEAFLLEWIDARWQPVSIDDGTVSDGKMDTYTRCVIDILGSPEAFFTSVFAAQGRQPLSAYTSSAIKSLLAELLGHAAILTQAAAAGEVAKLLKAGLVAVRAALTDMEAEWAAVGQAARDLPGAKAQEAAARAAREAAQKALLEARDRLTTLNGQASADQANTTRRQEIVVAMREVDRDWETATTRLKQQAEAEATRQRALECRQTARIATLRSAQCALDKRIDTLNAVLADAPRIRFAVRRGASAKDVFSKREAREAAYRARVQRAREIDASVAALRTRIAGLEREAGRASLTAEDLTRRLGLSGEVPCSGTEMQAHCKLLGDAREARSLLPSAEHSIRRLSTEREEAALELRKLEAELAGLGAVAVAFDIAERKRAAAGRRMQRFDRLASRAAEIDRARQDLSDALRQRAALGTVDNQPTAEEGEERQAIDAAIAQIATARGTIDDKRTRETAALARQLAQLPAPFDTARVQAAAKAVGEAQSAASAADQCLTATVRRVQTLTDFASKREALEAKVADARGNVQRIEAKVIVWSLLAKALGNDGIVALSIDDAGPTLSALANDLLLNCYGPRFTVSLRTQVATAKGEAREGFSIVVHDAESGQAKELDSMSGGEKLWVNDSLTRAIALYLAQNSGLRYETLFSDEADGPLDEEHKRMFMAMKREVLRLGGYRREFFISQTPALTQMADAVIDLDAMREEAV